MWDPRWEDPLNRVSRERDELRKELDETRRELCELLCPSFAGPDKDGNFKTPTPHDIALAKWGKEVADHLYPPEKI